MPSIQSGGSFDLGEINEKCGVKSSPPSCLLYIRRRLARQLPYLTFMHSSSLLSTFGSSARHSRYSRGSPVAEKIIGFFDAYFLSICSKEVKLFTTALGKNSYPLNPQIKGAIKHVDGVLEVMEF